MDIACHLFTLLVILKRPHTLRTLLETYSDPSLQLGRTDPTHCMAVLYSAPASSMTSSLPSSLWSHMTGSEEGKEWNASLNTNHFLYVNPRTEECFWQQEAGSDMLFCSANCCDVT